MSLKVIYAGTPQFSVAALEAIVQSEHQVIAAYTQPDRRAGRGKKLTPSPVKQCALAHQIPIFQPESFKDPASIDELKALNADIMVVTAYGLILPTAVLEAFPYGCINIHASLLPRWRGAAPIQRAIEAGDEKTGITIMQMDEGLDTGDILLRSEISISATATGESLHDDLMQLGAAHIVSALDQIEAQTIQPQAQNDKESSYAHKMTKAEGIIDWNQEAIIIDRKIRAFYPWPGTVTHKNGQAIKIIQAHMAQNEASSLTPGKIIQHNQQGLLVACKTDAIRVTRLQIPGKKPIEASQLAHAKNWSGEQFDLVG